MTSRQQGMYQVGVGGLTAVSDEECRSVIEQTDAEVGKEVRCFWNRVRGQVVARQGQGWEGRWWWPTFIVQCWSEKEKRSLWELQLRLVFNFSIEGYMSPVIAVNAVKSACNSDVLAWSKLNYRVSIRLARNCKRLPAWVELAGDNLGWKSSFRLECLLEYHSIPRRDEVTGETILVEISALNAW